MAIDPQEVVDSLAHLNDNEIDIGLAALALGALDQPGISLQRYVHHLDTLAEEVGARHLALLRAGAVDSLETRLAALKHIISDQHAYIGDVHDDRDFENMNLIRVIERGKGISITLGLLYMYAARAQEWEIVGLNMPGHFVCRLDKDGLRLIFDPFQDCKILEAADLRLMVKQALGDHAELSSSYFEAASNRGILIRLLNKIKYRKIQDEDYKGALSVVERMRGIDPEEFRLLLDAGVLYARVEHTRAAIDALEDYIRKVPKSRAWDGDRHDAELLLLQLKGKLN